METYEIEGGLMDEICTCLPHDGMTSLKVCKKLAGVAETTLF